MKLELEVRPKLARLMAAEIAAGERAVTRSAGLAANDLKLAWRGQITSAGLGRRLANTIRSRRYPARGASFDAAAFVWSNAPTIVDAHDRGALIRSASGVWLAIPTAAAGRRGLGGTRLTPGSWEARTGQRLRFVYRRSAPSLLVADDARLSSRGVAAPKRGRRRKRDGILTGAQTVPIFLLVRQVKLPKRLDLDAATRRVAERMPGLIVETWVSRRGKAR